MKKLLIFSILFSSIFLFNSNIKALSSYSVLAHYDDSYIYGTNNYLLDSQKDFLDNQLIPYLDEKLGNDYAYFITTYSDSSGPDNTLYIAPMGSGNFSVSPYVRGPGYTNWLSIRYFDTFPDEFHGASTLYSYNVMYGINSSNYITWINNFVSNPTYTNNNVGSFTASSIPNSSQYFHNDYVDYLSYLGTNQKLLYYSNVDVKIASGQSDYQYFSNYVVDYDGEQTTFTLGDSFPFYKTFLSPPVPVVNKVIDLGDNAFGFYQDYVGLNLTSLSGAVDTLSIVCEQDRPFNNNYCFLNYNDLINHNSDISVFNDYGASFTQLFGGNTGYLLNDRYYLYSFRIQKPFVPQVGNLFINSLTNNSNQTEILGVYLQDGGSYTDYVIKFKISNSDYTTSTSLNDITIVFRDGLSSYFSTIPTSFSYSVFRSFKLQYFSTEPTMEQVNNFYNSNDLSSIDGRSSNNSFFTDNDFNTYGFGGIITAPFRFLYAIENYQTCTDIVLPFPHSNDTITLSCVRNSIPTSISPLITILQLILSGFICYRIAVETLSIIKELSSPDKDVIEVVDL